MNEKKPKLIALTYVGFQLAAALAAKPDKILSFNDLYHHLDQGTLFEWLSKELGYDFSLLPPGDEQTAAVQRALTDASWGYRDRERRKSGIETSGLHLISVLILEAIQRHDWE
jgi:hypothetical protein